MNENHRAPMESQRQKLQRALAAQPTLHCADVEELLIALVHAEAAGEDVEQQPQFQPAFEHLATCPECLALYEELAHDVTLLTTGEAAPQPASQPPIFFTPSIVRQTKALRLQAWKERPQRVQIQIPSPWMMAKGPLVAGRTPLFTEQIVELEDQPQITGRAILDAEQVHFQIAVSPAAAGRRWRVSINVGGLTIDQLTDDAGVAEFGPIQRVQLTQVIITCTEANTPDESMERPLHEQS